MTGAVLLVAVNCGRAPGLLDFAAKRAFLVLGTIDAQPLAGLEASLRQNVSAVPVYFYETG